MGIADAGLPDAAVQLDADVLDSAVGDASLRDAAASDASVRDAAVGDAAVRDAGADAMTACVATSERDAICDGVDDDCNGAVDEDFVPAACGMGFCRSTSVASRCEAGAEIACEPGTAPASVDTTLDGVDDDCDGQVDEEACMPSESTYGKGAFTFSPPAHCTTMTVELWGGGGASGDAQAGYWMDVTGGRGGAGGYARRVLSVSAGSMVSLYVGAGGAGCGTPGAGGLAAHGGGAGGTGRAQTGTNGQDGSVMGGTGGNSNSGGDGGRGYFGGGGGGAGDDPGFAPHGSAGGGGAASVLTLAAVRVVAGGGGGGGGAGSDIATAGFSGGRGGAGCSEAGQVASTYGGGGGGGGVCQGDTTQRGSGHVPHDPGGVLPSGAAHGGDSTQDCAPGGDGYAVVSFSQ